MKNTRLELTWIDKENQPRLEPRILVEDAAKSHHAPFRTGWKDIFDNRLIYGDNLLALKALEQEFVGKVKCIFINTARKPWPFKARDEWPPVAKPGFSG